MRRRSDLNLEADPSTRFLPWIIAVMVFLATLTVAGALVLNTLVAGWRSEARNSATVQIIPGPEIDAAASVEQALAILRATPGIERARALSEKEVRDVLAPWLGPASLDAGLPVPRVIDVVLAAETAIDPAALALKIESAVPGARFDGHGTWMAPLIEFVRTSQAIALVIVLIITLATVAIIVFSTRAGLAAHNDAVQVLHLIGARDVYIARQFQLHCLNLALKGAVAGFVLAFAAGAALALAARELDSVAFGAVQLGPGAWATLVLVPLLAMVLTVATARLTVLRALRRLV